MTQEGMPEGLPDSFEAVWEALRQADEESTSRQELARRLRVSTHTIQRILVDGSVPDFGATSNNRVLRAWVRIITRLAYALGKDPREWVELVGIRWNETSRAVSEAALAKVTGGPSRDGLQSLADAMRRPAGGRPKMRWPDPVRVGIVERGSLSRMVSSLGGSFLEIFTRRLLGALRSESRLRIQTVGEDQAVMDIVNPGAQLDLGVGVIDTIRRRLLGLGFLPIPGFDVELSGVCLYERDSAGLPPTWREVTKRGRALRFRLAVVDDVTKTYLTGQCGIPSDELLVMPRAGPTTVARSLLAELGQLRKPPVILVADRDTCLAVKASLAVDARPDEGLAVEEVISGPHELPRYDIAIAVREGRGIPSDLMRAALDEELFGSSAFDTAALYAAVVVESLLESSAGGLHATPHPVRILELADFELAGPAFRRSFYRNLLLGLREEVARQVEAGGTVAGYDAVLSRSSEIAVAYAECLMPPAWLIDLETEMAAEPASVTCRRSDPPGRGPFTTCQSCSVSLLEEGHRGASDRYCRYCSDEAGRLKPRREVQRILAKWFQRTRTDLADEEAERRAGLYMMAMPAWARPVKSTRLPR